MSPPFFFKAMLESHVYMLTNQARGVIYISVTSDIRGRMSEHKQGLTPGFASKSNCTRLIWFERHEDIEIAIQREKSLKRWRREWKVELIEGFNPTWRDLTDELDTLDNVYRASFEKRYDELIPLPADMHRILGSVPEDDGE